MRPILQRCVYIASDGGRVCRPLVIADKGVSRIKEHHMKELRVIATYARSIFQYGKFVNSVSVTGLKICFDEGWSPYFQQFSERGSDRVP